MSNRVLAILSFHQGKSNAITSRELALQLDLSPREVREMIAEMVRDGALIGASVDANGGYYMIETAAELEETRAILRSRARHIFQRDDALRQAWSRLHGQAVQPLLPEMV